MSFTSLTVHCTIMVSSKLLMKWHIFKWQLHFIIFPVTAPGVASGVTRKTQFHYTEAIWHSVSRLQMKVDLKFGADEFLGVGGRIYVLKHS